ncbi:TrkH family potassium uptake protein [Luteimonas viscosa]|uniref:TrkH family potassium uptake protein n=1 Tax=Luteimonas viscosa TaxID=1132694 RepID=UPI001CA46A48|nr:potassium transporter TrkG [Luteimonas viscosa]
MRKGIRHPARLVPLGFLVLISIGTALLMLPAARNAGVGAPLLTALFTSTSAVCVTGLVVVDTPVYWSTFGQWIILGLFQAGGLGIMTGATLLGLLVAGRLGLESRLAAQAETREVSLGNVRDVLRIVVLVTLVVEGATTLALTLRFHFAHGAPWGQALWEGLFHAVSAFNNAGFSTRSDSLTTWAGDALVIVPLTLAVLLGGLGFPVLSELRRRPLDWRRWSVHTRLTLQGTALLVVGGATLIAAYEWHNPATFGALEGTERVLGAMFHSIAARTAGFNTVDVGAMQLETQAVTWALMFIGGGSGGTAGGIKITTFMLLGYAVWAEARGSQDTVVFRRRVPDEALRLALAVVLMALTVLAFGVLALLSVTDLAVEDAIFESISASATVGLSTGVTATLPPAGQAILIALMFIGRVGSVTLVTALAMRRRPRAFRYPEERPIVG